MSTDFINYEHRPGATKTLVTDPNTGLVAEVDVDPATGQAKFPELKPTYRPTAEEIEAAKPKPPTPPTTPVPPRPPTNPAQ
jgi:hypothetical protein